MRIIVMRFTLTKVMGLALKMSIEGRARLKRVRQLKTSCR